MSSPKNLNYQKTSFLSKANINFIEDMYVKYMENDPTLPKSWKSYFGSLKEDLNSVAREIKGPTWNPNKIKIEINKTQNFENKNGSIGSDLESQKIESIKLIALIRAYRIRGHLIANLDPCLLYTSDAADE